MISEIRFFLQLFGTNINSVHLSEQCTENRSSECDIVNNDKKENKPDDIGVEGWETILITKVCTLKAIESAEDSVK